MASCERAAVTLVAQNMRLQRKDLCRAHLRRALRDRDDSICSQQRPRGLVEERHLHVRANACLWPGFSNLPISNRMAPLPQQTQHTLTGKPTPTGSDQSYMSP